ncbi:hypothetical protein [Embleya sp. NBC_00896]|uniref:hypothetical protein n=1 Tax=Embleya sp. NBC_00896 TaxID=2975961 RepID=UPI00386EDA13|nr:hypothetical protein OG928_32525 [Embleya sp. NBC_00896]
MRCLMMSKASETAPDGRRYAEMGAFIGELTAHRGVAGHRWAGTGRGPPVIIAALTRMVRDVGVAEEPAQDALVAALEQ